MTFLYWEYCCVCCMTQSLGDNMTCSCMVFLFFFFLKKHFILLHLAILPQNFSITTSLSQLLYHHVINPLGNETVALLHPRQKTKTSHLTPYIPTVTEARQLTTNIPLFTCYCCDGFKKCQTDNHLLSFIHYKVTGKSESSFSLDRCSIIH